MNINILEIVIVLVTLVFVISGFRTGFVKKLASMLSLVLSIVLVSAVLPYVTDFIQNNTPLYDYIVEQCERVAAEQLGSFATGEIATSFWSAADCPAHLETFHVGQGGGTVPSKSSVLSTVTVSSDVAVNLSALSDSDEATASFATDDLADYVAGLTREEVKELMEAYGYGDYTYLVDLLSDEELEAYKEQYLQEYLSQLLSDDDTASVIASLSGSLTLDDETQTEINDSLPIPEVIKNLLIRNNNEDGYESLNVSTFQDYIIEYLATLILNVVSFLVAVILVHVCLHLVIMLLNVLAHFPVIGIVNRLAGAGLGVVEALFALWLFFLLLTVLQATEAGAGLLAMVEESSLLTWLYESNLFLRIVV
ncbi:MAG: CvpA family protein, partial [Lachnospiraceae bacterium]|nr:CvpA family protein [Lachnospiraceae bacterium]